MQNCRLLLIVHRALQSPTFVWVISLRKISSKSILRGTSSYCHFYSCMFWTNRYCWCQDASPLCTAACCRLTSVLQCCCCSDDGTGYKQLYTLLQDGGHIVSLILVLSPEYFCNLCHRIPRQLDTLCKHYHFSTIQLCVWGEGPILRPGFLAGKGGLTVSTYWLSAVVGSQ